MRNTTRNIDKDLCLFRFRLDSCALQSWRPQVGLVAPINHDAILILAREYSRGYSSLSSHSTTSPRLKNPQTGRSTWLVVKGFATWPAVSVRAWSCCCEISLAEIFENSLSDLATSRCSGRSLLLLFGLPFIEERTSAVSLLAVSFWLLCTLCLDMDAWSSWRHARK